MTSLSFRKIMGSVLYSKRHDPSSGRNRKTRPKTFKTEEKAKEFAEKNKIKDYRIEKLNDYKFRVVS